jgi:phosphoribosylformylglycinamidine synthase
MLYLPPGWAHEGTAVDGPCMTCSVGFRAPSRLELLRAFLADCADDPEGPDPRYADRGSPPAARPGRVPDAMADALVKFRDRGGLVLGICTGFQVLLQTGLLLADPASGRQEASLAHNTSGRFIDRWVRLACGPGPCVFLRGLGDLELPVAHGEGRFVLRDPARLGPLRAAGQLPLTYACDDAGRPTNPNGAVGDVAGACDPSGRVFGLMPHPERFIDATQHPSWHGRLDPSASGAGLTIFTNAVKAMA